MHGINVFDAEGASQFRLHQITALNVALERIVGIGEGLGHTRGVLDWRYLHLILRL